MRILISIKHLFILTLLAVGVLSISSCDPDEPTVVEFDGAVYVMSNKSTTNSIIHYNRNENGSLAFSEEVNSGGAGSGVDPLIGAMTGDAIGLTGGIFDPLLASNSLAISPDNAWIFACNVAAGSVSSFRVEDNNDIVLASTIDVGLYPNTIAVKGNVMYVGLLNDGGTPFGQSSIKGFTFDTSSGEMTEVAGSTIDLGHRTTTLQFAQNSNHLIVSEITSGNVHAYEVNMNDGTISNTPSTASPATLSAPRTAVSNPFGMASVVSGNTEHFVVAEARAISGDPLLPFPTPIFETSSVASYALTGGSLSLKGSDYLLADEILTTAGPNMTTSNATTETCWITYLDDLAVFYSTNAGSTSLGSISSGTIDLTSGEITILNNKTRVLDYAPIDGKPDFLTDMQSTKGNYLYILHPNGGSVSVHQGAADGSAAELYNVSGNIPTEGSTGLVAF